MGLIDHYTVKNINVLKHTSMNISGLLHAVAFFTPAESTPLARRMKVAAVSLDRGASRNFLVPAGN
jgi:hypothetical protein